MENPLHKAQLSHLSLVVNWYNIAMKGKVLEGALSQAFERSKGSNNYKNYEIRCPLSEQ